MFQGFEKRGFLNRNEVIHLDGIRESDKQQKDIKIPT
jgi:hypothetical protein